MLKVPRVLQDAVPLDRPELLVREVTSEFEDLVVAKVPKVALVRVDLAEREVASETPAPLEQQVFAGSLVLLVFKVLPA